MFDLRLIATSVAVVLGATAMPQDSKPSPYLLGDPNGQRAALAAKGVNWDLYWSNFYQGAVSGRPKGMEFGGRLDLYLDFSGEKLMNWKGGGISTKVELKYGKTGRQGGAILPSNVGMLSPIGFKERPVVTSLHVKQRLGKTALMVGKIAALDLLRSAPMMGGRGLDGFSHMEFAAPLSGVTPIVLLGAVAAVPTDWGSLTFMAYDPNDQTNNGGFDRAFEDGVNLAVSAGTKANFTPFGGAQSVGFKYSTKRGSDLSEIGQPGANARSKRGSWAASYQIEQLLNPAWGVFAMISFADGNPNIHQNSYQVGLGGKGLLKDRPADRFGLGYFNMNFSDALSDAILPAVRLRREQGVEAFYNYEVRPGLNLTGDVQWLQPTDSRKKDAWLLGLRAVVRF